jgi:hypothetical protein
MQHLVFLRSGRPGGRGATVFARRLARLYQCLVFEPGDLVDAPARDLLDEEFGEGPHQRVGAVGQGAVAAHAKASTGRSGPAWASNDPCRG